MSTKINVRSPFYLNLAAPVPPTPTYTCDIAGLLGFAVDNKGIITAPHPDIGSILSFTSSDSGFADNKYAAVSSATTRTIVVKLRIPAGYTNSDDVFFNCTVSTTQPVSSSCSGGPSTQGTISNKTLVVGGSTITIALAGFFNNETVYVVTNDINNLVTTGLTGSSLTLSAGSIGGSGKIYIEGRDANYPTTCAAIQPIAITVNQQASPPAYDCDNFAKLSTAGGSITQAGVITKPTPTGAITQMSLSSGGSAITSVSANTGSSAQNVQIFFSITAPAGYSNAGSTIICPKTFSQPGTTAPTFTCDIANLSKQNISKNGAIFKGEAEQGSVKSFTPVTFTGTVSTDTSRTIVFQVLIPTGFANANGSNTINCSIVLKQPATAAVVGIHNIFLTEGLNSQADFCLSSYKTKIGFKSSIQINTDTGSAANLLGAKISFNGNDFDGKVKFYGISNSVRNVGGTTETDFYIALIDNQGIVLQVIIFNCKLGAGLGHVI